MLDGQLSGEDGRGLKYVRLSVIEQYFLNFNMHMIHPGLLLKCRFSRSGILISAFLTNLTSFQVMLWSKDHTLKSEVWELL